MLEVLGWLLWGGRRKHKKKNSELYRGDEKRRLRKDSKEKFILDLNLHRRVNIYQVRIPGSSYNGLPISMYGGGVVVLC